ncbi:hypothetical protein BurMR1_3048 [Burkholderia sp. MR1]|nr:hypothetical protein BurMR1_3048 [Burkholderia sp. MR1]
MNKQSQLLLDALARVMAARTLCVSPDNRWSFETVTVGIEGLLREQIEREQREHSLASKEQA